jgi:hypothetical protein
MPEELDLPEADSGNLIVGGRPQQGGAPGAGSGRDPLSIQPERPAPAAKPEPIPMDDADEPISLVEESDSDGAESGVSMVRQRGTGLRKSQELTFKRPLNVTGAGATRCRLFYSRIAVEALENMQMRINEWIDNDDIEVKHICQELAVMEGKTAKPNLIISVWY